MNEQKALRSRDGRVPVENKELPSDQERHSRKCQVCSHPERQNIEDEFIHWRKPRLIASRYDIPWVTLYRHAKAFNLFASRSGQLRSVLENIMERGVETKTTGDTVLRAVKYYTCLTDDNKWLEPTSNANVVFKAERREPPPPVIEVGSPAKPTLPEPSPMTSPPMTDVERWRQIGQREVEQFLIDTPND